MEDSRPKELFTDLPICHFDPTSNREKPSYPADTPGVYNCPIYKTVARFGVLLTTGHSTNFVMLLEVPSNDPQEKWIMAGVGAFLALGY